MNKPQKPFAPYHPNIKTETHKPESKVIFTLDDERFFSIEEINVLVEKFKAPEGAKDIKIGVEVDTVENFSFLSRDWEAIMVLKAKYLIPLTEDELQAQADRNKKAMDYYNGKLAIYNERLPKYELEMAEYNNYLASKK